MMNRKTHRPTACVFAVLLAALLVAPAVLADDLDDLGLLVFRNRDGYALAITEYEATSEADLIGGEAPEHRVKFTALIQPPEDAPAVCFLAEMYATEALDEDRDDALLPDRPRETRDYNAVLSLPAYVNRRGEPIPLAETELKEALLDRPGYIVETLVVQARAVLARETEPAEVPAVVTDDRTPIGRAMTVRVKAMEIDDKGKATIKLDMTRQAGDEDPILDSVFALNAEGEQIGGGRWTEATDPFADEIEVTTEFLLMGDRTIHTLRLVLATRYEVVPVVFEVEDLFKQ